ncbi:hypothetical protein ACA910_008456 [Epithemia clementina (nom. ined.)]
MSGQLHMRGTTKRCQGAWHEECYCQHDGDPFPVLKPGDLDDALMDDEDPGDIVDDPDHFNTAHAGDFFMCAFQCDSCSFYNIKQKYPNEKVFPKDDLLSICIRWANLDAFWARERSTVARNRTEMMGLLKSAEELGIHDPLPGRGPLPTEDTFGMGTVCAMLLKTRWVGRNTAQIQFETARKLQATISNFVHTTPGGTGASTIGYGDRGGQFFTASPTNSHWFKRFINGCHRRMGDVWLPDKAVNLEEVLSALAILEDEFAHLNGGATEIGSVPH